VADLGSRNGTYLNGRRLGAATPSSGRRHPAGESGRSCGSRRSRPKPEAGETLAEHPVIAAKPAEVRAYGVTLLAAATGRRYEARGLGFGWGAAASVRCKWSRLGRDDRLSPCTPS